MVATAPAVVDAVAGFAITGSICGATANPNCAAAAFLAKELSLSCIFLNVSLSPEEIASDFSTIYGDVPSILVDKDITFGANLAHIFFHPIFNCLKWF